MFLWSSCHSVICSSDAQIPHCCKEYCICTKTPRLTRLGGHSFSCNPATPLPTNAAYGESIRDREGEGVGVDLVGKWTRCMWARIRTRGEMQARGMGIVLLVQDADGYIAWRSLCLSLSSLQVRRIVIIEPFLFHNRGGRSHLRLAFLSNVYTRLRFFFERYGKSTTRCSSLAWLFLPNHIQESHVLESPFILLARACDETGW